MKNITVEISAKGYTGLTAENIQKALDHYFGSPALDVSFSVTEATLAAASKRERELVAHIIKSDEFVEKYGEFPLSCVFKAGELLDERRALLAETEAK